MAKLNITMDDRLLEKMDNYADKNYMTRSGLIALCCNQFLNQQEVYGLIQDMSSTLKKISDKGVIDDSLQKDLDKFLEVCRIACPR